MGCSRISQEDEPRRVFAFVISKTQEKIPFSRQRWFSQAVFLHRPWNSQHLAANSEENYTNFLAKTARLWGLLREDTRIQKIKPSAARKEKEKKKLGGRKRVKQEHSKRNKTRFPPVFLNYLHRGLSSGPAWQGDVGRTHLGDPNPHPSPSKFFISLGLPDAGRQQRHGSGLEQGHVSMSGVNPAPSQVPYTQAAGERGSFCIIFPFPVHCSNCSAASLQPSGRASIEGRGRGRTFPLIKPPNPHQC